MYVDEDMTGFGLIMAGRYAEGIKKCEEDCKKYNRLGEKANITLGFLLLDEKEKALEVCKGVIDLKQDNSYYTLLGLCLWCLHQSDEAIRYWELYLKGKWTDISNGLYTCLLLYYAGITNNDAKLVQRYLKKIKKYVSKDELVYFTEVLAAYVSDLADEKALFASIELEPSLRPRYLCKAYFYIALKNRSSKAMYISYLQRVVDLRDCAILEEEYILAKFELETINNPN